MSSTSKVNQPLDGSNYLAWETAMKAILRVSGDWSLTAGRVPKPHDLNTDAGRQWLVQNDRALGLITINCNPVIQQTIATLDEASVAWTTLAKKYGQPGPTVIYVEFQRALKTSLHVNEDPSEKLASLSAIFCFCAANNNAVPDSQQAMIVLNAVPHQWTGFATTVLAGVTAGNNLTYAAVVQKIQEEWTRRSGKSQIGRMEEKPIPLQARLQAKPLRCKICRRSGHSTEQHVGKKEGSPSSSNKPTSGQSSGQPKTTKGKGKRTNKGKGKQRSQHNAEANAMDVDEGVTASSRSPTPLDEIALDIQSINPLAFGEVECVPPASGSSRAKLTQHLERNTKLWFAKCEEDE